MASNKGFATITFGAFPGATDVATAVADATIVGGAHVEAWIFPTATADHSADEHWVDPPVVMAGAVVAGVGFTIYARAPNPPAVWTERDLPPPRQNTAPQSTRGAQKNVINPADAGPFRCYGSWTVAWVWSS